MSPLLLLSLALLALVLLVVAMLLKRLVHLAAPNQVLVLSGSRRRIGNTLAGYRSIRGGRALQIPMLERVDVWDLAPIPLELESFEVLTRGDLPLRLTVRAVVCPGAEEPRLGRALECLLGRRREELAAVAARVLTGLVLAVARGLAAKQVMLDTAQCTEVMREELEHALGKLGLELDSLRVSVVPDSYGHEKSLRG